MRSIYMFFGKTNTDKSNLPLTRRIFGKTIHNAMVKDRADTQAKFNRSGRKSQKKRRTKRN